MVSMMMACLAMAISRTHQERLEKADHPHYVAVKAVCAERAAVIK